MHGWGLFFFLLFLLVIFGAAGWIIYTQVRARRAGLPPPSFKSYIPFTGQSSRSTGTSNYPTPRQGGVVGWIKDHMAALKNRRTAQGAYEEPLESGIVAGAPIGGRGGGRRGLDPDEAWDARVGPEADLAYGPGGYYEEQELGLGPERSHEPYGGTGYGGPPTGSLPAYGDGGDRGRSRSREPDAFVAGAQRGLDQRFDKEVGRESRQNPFGDTAERSNLRDVSPRPVVDTATTADAGKGGHGAKGSHDESPTERRSMFRESL